MKRHEGLKPLSQDHHQALVEAKHLRAAGETAGTDAAAARLLERWAEMEEHFREEERLLLPVLGRYTGSDCPEIAETLRQHVEIRGVVDAISERLDGGLTPPAADLHRLGALLRDHVRYEERVLFPEIEQVLPSEQLWRVQRQLRDRR
ncbi:MAG TPA: hemerythrin domain-containing protein [Gammaproteobacteria bacterium]|nr:hemerythrin domain-containing protein [Gammaproteobacteria bacterium]